MKGKSNQAKQTICKVEHIQNVCRRFGTDSKRCRNLRKVCK